jgi:hypothetical protein
LLSSICWRNVALVDAPPKKLNNPRQRCHHHDALNFRFQP